jgi:hypothetical protein
MSQCFSNFVVSLRIVHKDLLLDSTSNNLKLSCSSNTLKSQAASISLRVLDIVHFL